MPSTTAPNILVIAGHDPCGGAGIQADIEAIASNGGHAACVISAHTVQDSRGVQAVTAADPELLRRQLECLLADLSFAALKIGLLPGAALVETVADILSELTDIPLVLDPVLTSGAGQALNDAETLAAIKSRLLPLTTIITPNTGEARALGDSGDPARAAAAIMAAGADAVYLTGTHADTETVINRLYAGGDLRDTFPCERLPGEYHGSGCTLSAALSAALARGLELEQAVIEAQRYTLESLRHARRPGHGQRLPDRFFWFRDE